MQYKHLQKNFQKRTGRFLTGFLTELTQLIEATQAPFVLAFPSSAGSISITLHFLFSVANVYPLSDASKTPFIL
jgi:hypothetical protein